MASDFFDRVSSIRKDLLVISVREQRLLRESLDECGGSFDNSDHAVGAYIRFRKDDCTVDAFVEGVSMDENQNLQFKLVDELFDPVELEDVRAVMIGDIMNLACIIYELVHND